MDQLSSGCWSISPPGYRHPIDAKSGDDIASSRVPQNQFAGSGRQRIGTFAVLLESRIRYR
jgi:hypothetical protein